MKTTLTFEFDDINYDRDEKKQIASLIKANDLLVCVHSIKDFLYQKIRTHEKTDNLSEKEYIIYKQVFDEVNTIIDDFKVRDILDE